MTSIRFTSNIHRHVSAPSFVVEAKTVGEALDRYFEQHPGVRGYVLDNQGAVRHHMLVLLNGMAIRDRAKLSDAVDSDSEIFVFQALSGG